MSRYLTHFVNGHSVCCNHNDDHDDMNTQKNEYIYRKIVCNGWLCIGESYNTSTSLYIYANMESNLATCHPRHKQKNIHTRNASVRINLTMVWLTQLLWILTNNVTKYIHILQSTIWEQKCQVSFLLWNSLLEDNGLAPGRRQAIIRTNARILLIGPLGTNFIETLIGIETFTLKKCTWSCRLRNGVNFVSASMC